MTRALDGTVKLSAENWYGGGAVIMLFYASQYGESFHKTILTDGTPENDVATSKRFGRGSTAGKNTARTNDAAGELLLGARRADRGSKAPLPPGVGRKTVDERGVGDSPMFDLFRDHIQAQDVRAAYDCFLQKPFLSLVPKWSGKPSGKRSVAFSRSGEPRGGYYSFIVNRSHLRFYIRKPRGATNGTSSGTRSKRTSGNASARTPAANGAWT